MQVLARALAPGVILDYTNLRFQEEIKEETDYTGNPSTAVLEDLIMIWNIKHKKN